MSQPLFTSLPPAWQELLRTQESTLNKLDEKLARRTAAGAHILPASDRILAAYQLLPEQVRVVVVGQDPYPTPGHAVGLAFSAAPHVSPLPRSLKNIFTELCTDIGAQFPTSGDLSPWVEQGVLLLNRVLTVEAGDAGAHSKLGWEEFTSATITALAGLHERSGQPLVAVLWGKPAQTLLPLLGSVPAVISAHPSPLSARRGFFGSRPFTAVNELLTAQGARPIDWSLPSLDIEALF